MVPEHDKELNFGQYKGKMLSEVMLDNPGYIVWVGDNVDWFKMEPDVYVEAVQRKALFSNPKRKRRYYRDEDELDWEHSPMDFDEYY